MQLGPSTRSNIPPNLSDQSTDQGDEEDLIHKVPYCIRYGVLKLQPPESASGQKACAECSGGLDKRFELIFAPHCCDDLYHAHCYERLMTNPDSPGQRCEHNPKETPNALGNDDETKIKTTSKKSLQTTAKNLEKMIRLFWEEVSYYRMECKEGNNNYRDSFEIHAEFLKNSAALWQKYRWALEKQQVQSNGS